MDSRTLKQLATIIGSGSLTRAAERLAVTQPTLTRSIQALEDRVGEAVLERSRYGVRPTAIGLRLAEIGNRILEEENQASEVLQKWKHGYNYEVRVGVGPLLQSHIMNGFLNEIDPPKNYSLHFKSGSASQLIPELQRGSLDILLAPSFLDLDQSQLKREVIFHDELRVFAGKKSRYFGYKGLIQPKDLLEENWIVSGADAGFYNPGLPSNSVIQASMTFTGAIGMVVHLLDTRDVLLRMPVRAMILAKFAKPGSILSVNEQVSKRDISLWTTEHAMNERAVQIVEKQLKEYFQRLDCETEMFGVTVKA